ncbi:MAG: hypothetical protein ABI231_03115 [Candidatus Tumulicola sp.]
MHSPTPAEMTVRPSELHDLFRDREFDPFVDPGDALWSIAQVPQLYEVTRNFVGVALRVVLPANEVSPQTQECVERALDRYCSHKIVEARFKMAAWRRGAWTAFFWSIVFFGISLLLTAGVQQAPFLSEPIRTLVSETLVIAGWVIMWQPMDTLIEGWLPIRAQERTFRAMRAMRVTVEPAV